MKRICLLLLASAFFAACTHPGKKGLVGQPTDLPISEFKVDINKDTILRTPNGALFNIPAGSLQSSSGTVTLQLREAYNISTIVKAGLVTRSAEGLLSSGGMLWLQPKETGVTIVKPIRVAIPTTTLEKGMNLYKGADSSGRIVWASPSPLPENPQYATIDSGAALFATNCASCHDIGHHSTGPDLAHILRKFPQTTNEFINYLQHPHYKENGVSDSIIVSWLTPRLELYQCNLKAEFGSPGTTSTLSASEINAVYRYIQQESERKDLPVPANDLLHSVDSCMIYEAATKGLQQQLDSLVSLRNALVIDNGPLTTVFPDPTWAVLNKVPSPALVTPPVYSTAYYQFTLSTFGWFNLDMLMKDRPDAVPVTLFAKATGSFSSNSNLFLIIPSLKCYGEGGPSENDPTQFAFFLLSGKCFLPLGVQAYIIAVADAADGPAFGIQSFSVQEHQLIEVPLHTGTKLEFDSTINALDARALQFNVKDAKNAGKIRAIDTSMQNVQNKLDALSPLQPVGCNCSCGKAIDEATK